MVFRFKEVIYKVGINPCVDVPLRITAKMKPERGYIPVSGTINKHSFQQTLVAVRNGPFRLYLNGPMLKGGKVVVGDIATFSIEQIESSQRKEETMNPLLRARLKEEKLMEVFSAIIPSRRKEINRYLNYLKTEAALVKNVEKVVMMLRKEK